MIGIFVSSFDDIWKYGEYFQKVARSVQALSR